MSITATAIWECRTTGDDTNGGGFDPKVSVPGTDFSQQNTPQITFSDLVIGNPSNTTVTSAGNPFGATSPGNFIHVTGGTGFTVGWYEILSVSGTTATLDRVVGTAGSTGGTGKLGGSMASPGKVAGLMTGGNVCYIKNTGTYTITSTSAGVPNSVIVPPQGVSNTAPTMFVGYNTTRTVTNTDVGPTINMGAGGGSSPSAVIQLGNPPQVFRNVTLTNTSAFSNWVGVQITNATGTGGFVVERVQVNNLVGGFQILPGQISDIRLFSCYAFGCTSYGYNPQQAGITFVQCTSDTCGTIGANASGFLLQANNILCVQCLAINNNGSGFDQNIFNVSGGMFIDCDAYNNRGSLPNGCGFITGTGVMILVNCAAFGNQYNDIRDNLDLTPNFFNRVIACACQTYTTASFNIISNLTTGPSVGVQVMGALSNSPWNNPGGKDFSLNSVQGQKCQGQGFPRNFLNIPTASFWDIGAAQHQVP